MTDNHERWLMVARNVLSVLLAEHTVHGNRTRYERAAYELELQAHHFPPGDAYKTYRSIDGLQFIDEPVHHSTVLAQDTSIDETWLLETVTLYSAALDGKVFEANVKQLVKLGRSAHLALTLLSSAESIRVGVNSDEVVAELMTELVNGDGVHVEGETGNKAAEAIDDILDREQTTFIRTGVRVVDLWIGGLDSGDFIATVGAYKMRKSSLTRNVALNVARRAGGSVALYMLENRREVVAAEFISMLAIEWLIDKGYYKAVEAEMPHMPLRYISPKDLMREGNRYKRWDKTKVAAIEHGRAAWRELLEQERIRIYDRSHKGGNISTLASFNRVFMRDKRLYRPQLAIIDHAQRFNERGTDYERMGKIIPAVEELARRELVTTWLLSQMNAEGIDRAFSGGDAYGSGARGGGDLDAGIDYLLTTRYKVKLPDGQKTPPEHLLIELKHTRYGGGDRRAVVEIDPFTGYILNDGVAIQPDYMRNNSDEA